MDPFLQLIMALAVARIGRLKMTWVWYFGFDTSWVSSTMKSMGQMKSPTRIRTYVIFPFGTFTDRLANWMFTRVGRNSPNPSCWYTERGSKLILALRSRNARLISVCPMVQKMVGHLRSLFLIGIRPNRSSLMLVARTLYLAHSFSLLSIHIPKKFSTCWNLLDCIKKRHIQFDLIEHLEYIYHVHVLNIVPKHIWKWCYRLVNLISSCALVRCL